MNLDQLRSLFIAAGVTRLYAKQLAENDNSKNQIYFAGAVETLQVFPSDRIEADNSGKESTFKAFLRFGWLQESGEISHAPNSKLILYPQYPEVRFSGFLQGCAGAPGKLMMDRGRAKNSSAVDRENLRDRVLFLGVTSTRQTLGYVVSGNSEIAQQFRAETFPEAFVVFKSIPLPDSTAPKDSRTELLTELKRIHSKGWIESKQLDSSGTVRPCNAAQCGGFTLEAELGIPKNSQSEPDFHGWEVKQHTVSNFDRLEAGTITLMTPEPTGGFYRDKGPEKFVRTFGYPDVSGKPDRLNFGGVHRVGIRHERTGLTLCVSGFDSSSGKITNASGQIALVSDTDNIAASWNFTGLLEHWSRKHSSAVYVPSRCRTEISRQYQYGGKVRLGVGTDSLRFISAMIQGAVYYDPGIKLENASGKPLLKRRSQFRVASKNLDKLYASFETVGL